MTDPSERQAARPPVPVAAANLEDDAAQARQDLVATLSALRRKTTPQHTAVATQRFAADHRAVLIGVLAALLTLVLLRRLLVRPKIVYVAAQH